MWRCRTLYSRRVSVSPIGRISHSTPSHFSSSSCPTPFTIQHHAWKRPNTKNAQIQTGIMNSPHTRFFFSKPTPPPSRFPSLSSIQAAVSRVSSSALTFAYSTAKTHPKHFLLLAAALGLAGAFTYYRVNRWLQQRRDTSSASVPASAKLARQRLPTYLKPQWANSDQLKEMAGLIHALPFLISHMKAGNDDLKVSATSLSSFSSDDSTAPTVSPAEALERIRMLTLEKDVLDVITKDVPVASLITPIISLLTNPVVSPRVAKLGACILNNLCLRQELCETIAANSDVDLLVSLAHYSDFHAWNYLYLLQTDPERVRYFQQKWQKQRMQQSQQLHDPSAVQPFTDEQTLPTFLHPFHASYSTSAPSTHQHTASLMPVDPNVSLNCNSSPVSNFQSHFVRHHATPAPQGELSTDARELINMLLSLPPVHSRSAGESPVEILAHAVEKGVAQRGEGQSLAQIGRDLAKDVVQHGAALAAAYRSSLAGDDLALLHNVASKWSDPSASNAPYQLQVLLHSVFSRTSGYKIGHQYKENRKTAYKQELHYHAIRAFATLAQDGSSARYLMENRGIELLYKVYNQYPHELRVQIQVARALANLLEHAHAYLHNFSSGQKEPDARYATYHEVAQSGFLPFLVHWSQHALNYTDAAATKSRSNKKPKVLTPEEGATRAFSPEVARDGKVAISTQPSNPKELAEKLNRVDQINTVLHPFDDKATLPIPPPLAAIPVPGNGVVSDSGSGKMMLKASKSDANRREESPPRGGGMDADHHDPAVDHHPPTRLPHHPESSASLRNKLQLLSVRAICNMKSIQSYKHFDQHEEDRAYYLEQHDSVRFPILSEEVYQFYPLIDTLQPQSTEIKNQSSAQKHSRSSKKKPKSSDTSPLAVPPLAPPRIEYDIVFLHGLMGNPLRTFRLHSMHDKTIGWIPSTPEEKRKAGMRENQLREFTHVPSVEEQTKARAGKGSLSALDLHLSNIVSSGPLPVEAPKKKKAVDHAPKESSPTEMADSMNVWGSELAHSNEEHYIDPSPAAPAKDDNLAAIMSDNYPNQASAAATTLPPHATVHSSQHSLDFETLWPRDWLPAAFPNARILSLGYHTALSMKTTGELHSKTLEERAREMSAKMALADIGKDGRKIIWVTHSMGGLIVKRILTNIANDIQLKQQQQQQPIAVLQNQIGEMLQLKADDLSGAKKPSLSPELLENTIATVFYSTPHKGTWLPSAVSHESYLSHVYYPSLEILDLRNQLKLKHLNDEFHREVIDKHHVDAMSMGEGIGTPLIHLNLTTQKMINWRFVMPESSQPGFGKYLYFPTQNHLTICKPKTELDENYSALKQFIQQAMEKEEKARSNKHE